MFFKQTKNSIHFLVPKLRGRTSLPGPSEAVRPPRDASSAPPPDVPGNSAAGGGGVRRCHQGITKGTKKEIIGII